MNRISREALCRAIDARPAMDRKQKEQLGDEIFRAQPRLFGSFLVCLKRIVPEESDKYVMLAAANFVNCIAFVPMNAPVAKADIASPHAQ